MKITWYGHAAFAVQGETAEGPRKVILDPYNDPGCGGYAAVDDDCDIVTVSHDNPTYHSDLSTIRGEPDVLEALDLAGRSKTLRGVPFRAWEVYEDAEGNGPNAMVRFELEGLHVAHQGDLGHALEGDALEFLRGVDVLLALTGGAPTIALGDLLDVVRELKPALVVPMHFKTPKVNLNILPLGDFLAAFREYPVDRPGASTIEVSRDTLPTSTRIAVLEHAR